MAKVDKKATEPVTVAAKEAKYNSSAKRRTLKSFNEMTPREKVVAIVKKSAGFSRVNNFDGLELSKKDPKLLASNLNVLVKPMGRIETMDDVTFGKLKALAPAALGEMKSGKYGSATKALLNFCLVDLKGTGGGGSKGFTSSSVSEWSI